MHFDWTVSLGNLGALAAILGGIWRVEKLFRKLDLFLIEHEILIRWYCETHDIQLKDLPTRSEGVRLL